MRTSWPTERDVERKPQGCRDGIANQSWKYTNDVEYCRIPNAKRRRRKWRWRTGIIYWNVHFRVEKLRIWILTYGQFSGNRPWNKITDRHVAMKGIKLRIWHFNKCCWQRVFLKRWKFSKSLPPGYGSSHHKSSDRMFKANNRQVLIKWALRPLWGSVLHTVCRVRINMRWSSLDPKETARPKSYWSNVILTCRIRYRYPLSHCVATRRFSPESFKLLQISR